MASKGEIHDIFQTNIEEIASQGGDQGDMARGKKFRPWNRPDRAVTASRAQPETDPESIPGLDPLDIAGITDGYNRDEIDTNYGELLKSGADAGTTGHPESVRRGPRTLDGAAAY